MQTALRTTTRVLPGGQVTVTDPELKEGETVDVIVLPSNSTVVKSSPVEAGAAAEFFASLPASKRTPAEWEEFDRQFRRDRDEWDR